MYHKHTTHTTYRRKKFDKKRPPLGGFKGFYIYSTVKDPYPDAQFLLMNCGMGCVSCPASQMESLTEACQVHGLDAEEVARYLNVELGLIEI